MFLTPHTSHWYYPVSKPWEVCWVSFNGMYVQQLLMNLEFVKSGKVVVTKNNDVEEKVKQIIFLLEANDAFSQFDSSPIFYQLILDLVKLSTFNEDVINQHYNVLRPVFRYLEIHYHQELTLRDIADQLAVTPQHTCLLFQQALGMRPFEYVTKIRIRKAKEKLVKEPDVPISTVAYRVGFQNVSYFIKVFKKHEGQTPAEFRKYHKV